MAYAWRMGKKLLLGDWGARFKRECQLARVSTRQAAEKIGQAESTVRSWINGTRQLNLTDFFRLCDAAGVNPGVVLFADVGKVLSAWELAEGEERESLALMAEAILARHGRRARGTL